MSYESDYEQRKKEIERVIKQKRFESEVNKAITTSSNTKFKLWKKNKKGSHGNDYNKRIHKFLKDEKA